MFWPRNRPFQLTQRLKAKSYWLLEEKQKNHPFALAEHGAEMTIIDISKARSGYRFIVYVTDELEKV